MKIYTNEWGHITNMAAMPIYGKNLKKSSFPESIDRWPWNLVCCIVYVSTTKVIQIMTPGRPWLIIAKVMFGHIGLYMGKREKYFFFETIAALGLKVA